jgi:hypothetical protein
MSQVSRRQWLVTFLPAVLLLIALAVFGLGMGKDIGRFLREPTTTAGLHPLIGFVSNLGVLLWAAAASVSFFAASIVRHGNSGDSGDAAGFLVSSGSLSMYLCLDDLFQIHEDLASRYFGIPERYVYVALALAVLIYLVRYRQLLLKSGYPMLVAAFVFLGTSVVIDDVLEPFMHSLGQGRILIEDGAKWLGVAAWCGYHVCTAKALTTGKWGRL